MSRREFTAATKREAYALADGFCMRCTAPLRPGKIRYNHRIPDYLGGAPTVDNCEVLCVACDHPQTYQIDIPRIAKTKRVHASHIGAQQPRGRGFLTNKRGPFKRKIDGTLIRRNP